MCRRLAAAFAQPCGLASLRSTLSQAGSGLAVLMSAGEPLAFCLYQQVVDEVSILQMATAPAMHRRGLGLELLRYLQQSATARGCMRLILEVRQSNQPARGLYAAAGFLPLAVRRGYYADSGEDALILACPLPIRGS